MDVQSIVIAILGGGGAAGLIAKLWQIISDHRKGQLDREDTAITRWQAIADRAESEAQKDVERLESENSCMRAELSWYRTHYSRLWAAWKIGPPPGQGDFPPSYTSRDN